MVELRFRFLVQTEGAGLHMQFESFQVFGECGPEFSLGFLCCNFVLVLVLRKFPSEFPHV